MNVIVCIKYILDPEMPPAKFKIDTEAKKVIPPEGIPLVVSPFDEQAVEAALTIKDKQDTRITAMTMGQDSAKDAVKHVLSMGADEGVVLSDETFEGSDAFSTAYVLSKAIEKIGEYDLILCGRQAADWDAGQVGSIIAENLGIPVVTLARKVEVIDSKLRVERVIPDGYEIVEVSLPAVVTVSSEIGQARLPSGRGIIMAARKQIPVWSAQDIDCDLSAVGIGAARSELLGLFVPSQDRKGEIISGENAAEAADNLALRLKESKII
ncbi:MAG: electron transfer flavoprotein subunit beta/FixA family protein [Dehalococcoidia bacterium]|nr:electron transfer flavoprotein subunit beta/FixA family protein [Dehalococcoidia bacterium]